MVYTSDWRFQNGEYPVREILMAKLYAYRISVEVADECIQIHGGAGYMKEYGIERSWRDLRLNRIGAGTDEIMLDVIGRSYGLEGGRAACGPPGRGACTPAPRAHARRAAALLTAPAPHCLTANPRPPLEHRHACH